MSFRKIIKYIVLCPIFVLVLPFGLTAKIFYLIFHSQLLFDIFNHIFSLFPGLPGTYTRACYYKQTLRKSHIDLDVGFGSYISKIEAKIGKNVLITGGTSLGNIEVGDRAVIANHVSVLSGKHQHNFTDPNQPILNNNDSFKRLSIGADTFIGDRSVIMANVGSKTIVGAGSIVVKDIPDNVIAAGNPARVIKSRQTEESDSNTIKQDIKIKQ